MKYKTILMVLMVCGLFVTLYAEENNKQKNGPKTEIEKRDMWDAQGQTSRKREKFENPESRISVYMKTNDPKKYEELMELRDVNPKVSHEKLMEYGETHRDKIFPEGFGRGKSKPASNKSGELSKKFYQEFLDFVKEHRPEDYNSLMDLKKKDLKAYNRDMNDHIEKYGHAVSLYNTSPELGILKFKDIELSDKRDGILRQLLNPKTSEKKKKELNLELTQVVASRFDVLMEKKKVRYELYLARLKKIQARVEEQQKKLNKKIENKDAEVQKRIKELLEDSNESIWK